jgi:hypothetical protein
MAMVSDATDFNAYATMLATFADLGIDREANYARVASHIDLQSFSQYRVPGTCA